MIHFCRRVLHSTGEKVEDVDDAVVLADGGMGQAVVHEFEGVQVQ